MTPGVATPGDLVAPATPSVATSLPPAAYTHFAAAAAAHAQGALADAVAGYEQALKVAPRLFEAHNNLGNALAQLGRHEEAVRCYQHALTLEADADTHSNLGNALRHLGRLDESIASSRAAIDLDPRSRAAYNNLGLALAAQGRYEDAVHRYRQALSLDANDVDALDNLGIALRDLGRLREALRCHARAVELAPRRAAGHYHLGNALLDFGQIEAAAASYRRSLALQPRDWAVQLSLSSALRQLGEAAEAEAVCSAALQLEPDSAEALAFLGELHADRGRFTDAEALFRRAIARNPLASNAWAGIATHRKMTTQDGAWLQGVQGLAARPLPLRHAIRLRYSLGKYFDDVGQYADAFGHYRAANELGKRYGAVYDRSRMTHRIDALIRGGDASHPHLTDGHPSQSRPSNGHPSDRPVFIVGMPRSGTSLTEQILASHPAAFGAGELNFWDSVAAAQDAAAPQQAAAPQDAAGRREPNAGNPASGGFDAGVAADYLRLLATRSRDAARVIDKMPTNFLHLGLIHAALPNARIIHMRRHPADTCLSIYCHYFANSQPHTNDLDDLAHYYGEYLRVMAHWRRVLPARSLFELPYEALVHDPETWTRRLLDFVELPWDPRCLDFHRTERVVITASKWQVRQRIHAASAGRWRHYEPFIAPLLRLTEPMNASPTSAPR